jgi:hypothetical protein
VDPEATGCGTGQQAVGSKNLAHCVAFWRFAALRKQTLTQINFATASLSPLA